MTETWEATFAAHKTMWGLEPVVSAVFAKAYFERGAVKSVLLPGVGYGRNAKAFLDAGMSVTGIEISETAIGLARSELHLDIPIHHGSVVDMPFDDRVYDAVFCYGLLYLLDASARAKLLRDCYAQLAPGGPMIFTVIAKNAPQYGQGTKLGEDWYEVHPGVPMFFYDAASIERDFGPYGLVEHSVIEEPRHDGSRLPFINIVCRKHQPAHGCT
jgi:SAM-dependent methyltransferase